MFAFIPNISVVLLDVEDTSEELLRQLSVLVLYNRSFSRMEATYLYGIATMKIFQQYEALNESQASTFLDQ